MLFQFYFITIVQLIELFDISKALFEDIGNTTQWTAQYLNNLMSFFVIFGKIVIPDHASDDKNILLLLHILENFNNTFLAINFHISILPELFSH